jgi:hypothetical protein
MLLSLALAHGTQLLLAPGRAQISGIGVLLAAHGALAFVLPDPPGAATR